MSFSMKKIQVVCNEENIVVYKVSCAYSNIYCHLNKGNTYQKVIKNLKKNIIQNRQI